MEVEVGGCIVWRPRRESFRGDDGDCGDGSSPGVFPLSLFCISLNADILLGAEISARLEPGSTQEERSSFRSSDLSSA